MTDGWLEIESRGTTTRVELRPGLTRLAAAGGDVSLPAAPSGELHVWDDPPKVVYLGAGEAPRMGGASVEERALSPGDRIEWGPVAIRYCEPARAAPPVIEEIPLAPPAPPPARIAAPPGSAPAVAPLAGTAPAAPLGAIAANERAWTRVRAGMLVELGLADKKAAHRWQEAVLRGEYDADACARDLLATATVAADDPRLAERAGRLLRDFLMTPLASGTRGASRRVRGAAKSGAAFAVAQLVVLLVYTAILLTVMVLARLKWNWSFDSLFDGVLGR